MDKRYKMRKGINFLMIVLLTTVLFASCREIETVYVGGGDTEDVLEPGEYKNGVLNTTNMDDWHYFNFEKGRLVVVNKADDYDVKNGI